MDYGGGTFYNAYIEYATLHVPENSIDAYKTSPLWKDFGTICGLAENKGQCAKPEITYENGRLEFTSQTSGAKFYYSIKDEDTATDRFSDGIVNLYATLNISVHAEADGYDKSETTTATLCWINGTLSSDDIETVRVEKRPIIVSANNGTLNVKGVSSGEHVVVYSAGGMLIGSATANGDEVNINARSIHGNIVIIKIGEESIKILMNT